MVDVTGSGYNGKALRVNLSDKTISSEVLDESLCRKYLGGAGLVVYSLWKELQPGIDPLGPDNKLIFATGPVTGVPLAGSGRHCVGGKSPLTGGVAKSEAGEFWGAEFKRAGYDVLIVEGKAEKPVYLWIRGGEVQIKDASHLWGRNTKETQQVIRDELGDSRVRVALIGPAGENLVRYACIMHGLYDVAGRGGLGAVMGSKNLKAIAVRGRKKPPVADPQSLKEMSRWLAENMVLVKNFTELGTGAAMEGMEAQGNLPVRNFRDGLFPGVRKIDALAIRDTIRIRMDACFGCPVRCKKVVEVQEPYRVDPAYGGPEYETLASLGSNCGIDNLIAIAKGSELCNAYGLDTISAGLVISFAMECFENELLSIKETDGLELRFGNAEAMLKTIELIANRQGIGDLLAEGVARAAEKIGRGASEFAVHVKGLEPGMHEPRLKGGLGLGFMVNPHGADHCTNLIDTIYCTPQGIREMRPFGMLEPVPVDEISPRKVVLFRYQQFRRLLFDHLVMCLFLPYNYERLTKIVAAVTGWDTGIVELMRIAERTLTMGRLFNIREGFTAEDDKLPQRFLQPKTDGVLAGKTLDPAKLEDARSYYYTLMGWDPKTGIPLPQKLAELDIA
jgi:aldehyde:ferredoxin oxidoreductase